MSLLPYMSRWRVSAVFILLFAISISTIAPVSQASAMHNEMTQQNGPMDMMPCDGDMEMHPDCKCPHDSGFHTCDQKCAAVCMANMTMHVDAVAQMRRTPSTVFLSAANSFKRGLAPHCDPPPPKTFS